MEQVLRGTGFSVEQKVRSDMRTASADKIEADEKIQIERKTFRVQKRSNVKGVFFRIEEHVDMANKGNQHCMRGAIHVPAVGVEDLVNVLRRLGGAK